MTNSNKKIQRLVEIAQLYYEQNLTQSEISKRMGVSRPLVSRMLNEAKELGIVNIQIRLPSEGSTGLLDELRNKYNLRGGVIIPDANVENTTNQQIAAHILDLLFGLSPAPLNIGIGWGYILGIFTKYIEKTEIKQKIDANIFPLIGNSSVSNRDYHSNEIIRVFAEKTGATPFYLFAPAFLETEQEKRLYEESESFKSIDNGWKQMDTAIINLGNYPSVPDYATATRFGDLLSVRKAAGRMLCYYFERNGVIIESESDHTIQVPIPQLARCRNVIGIGSVALQPKALVGALKTGLLTHIITAESVAKQALETT